MPRGKFARRGYQLPPPPPLQQLTPTIRQQCCVVCYKNFTPFEFNSEIWDSNMIKNFYLSLDLGNSMGSAEGEEDEEVLSLPFCPQCHTKVSIMAAYQIELQNIKSKCNSIRNDIAFTVVETIGQNSRDGPIDYIRQQIYDKWKLTYEDQKTKSLSESKVGLEYIACEPAAAPHNCGNFVCFCHSDSSSRGSTNDVANGPPNGFDYDPMDFTDTSNAVKSTNKRSLLPPWRKAPLVPKKLPEMDRAPPLLSPQKASLNAQGGGGGIRSKIGAKISSIPVSQQKGKMTIPTVAQAQRSLGGPRKSGVTPSTGVRRKVDYSHVKPRVPSRFLTPMKGKVHVPSGDSMTSLVSTESKDVQGDSEAFGLEPDETKGKRKLSDTDIVEGSLPTKYLKESEIEVEATETNNDAPIATASPPRPTRTTSGRSPTKGVEEPIYAGEEGLFPCIYCPKVYEQKSRLLRHESDLHPECKEYQCDVDNCGKGFSSREAFKRHVHNNHHISYADMQMHRCAVATCHKTFLSAATLEKHTAQAHGSQEQTSVVSIAQDLKTVVEEMPTVTVEEPMKTIQVETKVDVPVTEGSDVKPTEGDTILGGFISGEDGGSEELGILSSSSKLQLKRKPTAPRLFGVRRRKRGPGSKGANSKKVVEDENNLTTLPKRRPRKPPPFLEPVRKSSRQRGVQMEKAQVETEGNKVEGDEDKGKNQSKPPPPPTPPPESDHIPLDKPEETPPHQVQAENLTEVRSTVEQIEETSMEQSVTVEENDDPNKTFNVSSNEEIINSTPSEPEESTIGERSKVDPALDVTYTVDDTESDKK